MITTQWDGAALVVGATGGLGQEIVKTFAESGSAVAFTYRKNREQADVLLGEIAERKVAGLARQADLQDIESLRALFDESVQTFGQIHSIVYAAGPVVRMTPIADMPPSEWEHMIRSDVMGFFNLMHAGIPHLRRSKGSVVALCTSGLIRMPPLDIGSAGPKASVHMLVKGIAREEGRNGIRANSIGVGLMEAGQGLSFQIDERSRRMAQSVIRHLPLARIGQARDIANAALFFASPMAGYVTGEMLCVDGGGHV